MDKAEFYRDEYVTTQGVDGYLTGDYRMAALSAHLFGLALNYDLDGIAQDNEVLSRTGVWISYERYFNSNNYSSNTFSTLAVRSSPGRPWRAGSTVTTLLRSRVV